MRGSRRRRRQWGGVWGGGVPSPLKKGSGEGAVPPSPEIKKKIFGSMNSKNFCVQAKGGGIAQWPPKYATGLCPWTPLGALPPDPRYRLVHRTRHGAPQPLTPSAAYAPITSICCHTYSSYSPGGNTVCRISNFELLR